MPEGGCYCGNVRYRYSGEVQGQGLCHCKDCQKISGSAYSTNIIVPGEGFEVTSGKPKEHTVTADSGKKMTSSFCDNCGSVMFRGGETFGSSLVIKVGTLDDPSALNNAKPAFELYTPQRANWLSALPGTGQKKGMPDSEDA